MGETQMDFTAAIGHRRKQKETDDDEAWPQQDTHDAGRPAQTRRRHYPDCRR
jgi:hypothetical protein